MRHLVVAALVAGLAVPAAAASQSAPSPVEVRLTPSEPCFLAGQRALVRATAAPDDQVAAVRMFFRAASGTEDHYLEMTRDGATWVATLPAASLDCGPVSLEVRAIGVDGRESRSAQVNAAVVATADACPASATPVTAAPDAPESPLYTSGGARAESVACFGEQALLQLAAAAPLFGLGKAAVAAIAGGAAAVGLGTAVAIRDDDLETVCRRDPTLPECTQACTATAGRPPFCDELCASRPQGLPFCGASPRR